MAKKDDIYFKATDTGLIPADACARQQFASKKYKVGQVVRGTIRKLRTVGLNKHAHKIGVLCVNNIDDFKGMDAHAAIKRIQLEGNIYCAEMAVKIHGFQPDVWKYVGSVVEPIFDMIGFKIIENGYLIARQPRSLSFDSMGEEEFQDVVKQICRFISDKYWPSMTPDGIERMSDDMIDE